VANWELYAGLAGGDTETRIEQPVSAEGATVYLKPGTYNFTLKGYKTGEALILEGIISNKEITLAGPNTLTFTMAPVLTGSGTVFITIDLPAGHNITAAKVYKDGTEITPSSAAEVNGDRVVFAQSCDAGAYFFSVHLFAANGDLYGVVPELAQVRANLTSAISQTLTLANLNRKYGITYHLNGGAFDSGAGVDNPGYYQSVDTAFTLPEPNRTGYAFGGWYGSNDVSTGGVVAGIAQGSVEDKEYWAKWTPVTYTITYALNNGTNAEQNPAVYTIETPTIILADPSRAGYDFQGWYTEAEFTNPATEIPLGSAGDKTFYARWTPVVYAITYILNSGTNAEQNPATYTIETPTITLAAPARAGYGFQGWYAEAEFTNPATEIPPGSAGDKTFYARWTPATYAITYILNNGTNAEQNPAAYTVETPTITLADPSRAGYSFRGWYTEAEFTNPATEIPPGSMGSKTFHAKWIPGVPVTITLQAVPGDPSLSNVSIAVGETPTFNGAVTNGVSYVWRWNGQAIDGATQDAYTLPDNLPSGIHILSVVATTAGGEKVSARCWVTINAQ
jgi:uncharacterized repeat protein (TIGR02543 family)